MKKVIYALLYSGNICHSVTEEVANQSPKVAIPHPIIEKNNIKPKSSYKYIIICLVCVFIAMILYLTLNNTNTNRKNEIQPNPVPIETSQSSPADIESEETELSMDTKSEKIESLADTEFQKAIKRKEWRDKLFAKSKQTNNRQKDLRKLLLEWQKTNNIEEYRTDHNNEEINIENLKSNITQYKVKALPYSNALPENCPLDIKQQGVNILILIEDQIRRMHLAGITIQQKSNDAYVYFLQQRQIIINNKHIFNQEEVDILWAYILSPWISEVEIRNCFA